MEVKKSSKANLENKKLLYRELGFIFALLVVLGALEYKSYEKVEVLALTEEAVEIEVENIPITTEAPPPPPEVPDMPVFSDIIDIVDDDVVVDDDIFISLEDDADMGVQIMDYVEEIIEEEIIEEAIPFAFVEEKPSFMGGDANEFSRWIGKNMEYPDVARENGIQGRVLLEFTVKSDGTVANVRVLRGLDASCDKEAMRVVSMSPKWVPGKQRNKAVPVTYQFPVVFQLR